MKKRVYVLFIFLLGVAFIFVSGGCPSSSSPLSQEQSPVLPPPLKKDTQLSVVSSTSLNTIHEGWKEIALFQGSDSAITEPFTILKAEWRLTWAVTVSDPEYAVFNIFVHRDNGQDMHIKKVLYSGESAGDICYFEKGDGDYYVKVIAANLDEWTIGIEVYDTQPSSSDVQITYIDYRGRNLFESLEIENETIEADEYVEIRNTGNKPQNINGWMLKNDTRGYPTFTFSRNNIQQINDWFDANIDRGKPSLPVPGHSPFSTTREMDEFLEENGSSGGMYSSFSPNVLAPHTAIRVYTAEFHPESGGFSFYYINGDIWNNSEPDVAVLYDSGRTEISRRSYITR
jgi:hypothetical protein